MPSQQFDAGALDRRVKILRVVQSNQRGVMVETPQEIATVWAKYNPTPRQENYSPEGTTATADAEFVIRYSSQVSDLKSKDSIEFDNRTYELIETPKEIGRREYLSLKVRLQDANATG